jgi:hypothetical protein
MRHSYIGPESYNILMVDNFALSFGIASDVHMNPAENCEPTLDADQG